MDVREIVAKLRLNRGNVRLIDGSKDKMDYSINSAIDEDFYSLFSLLDLKKIKYKSSFIRFIDELANETVRRSVTNPVNYIGDDDFDSFHTVDLNYFYLKDLLDKFIKNIDSNISLAEFYYVQIEKLQKNLMETHLREETIELLKSVNYEQLSNSFYKIVDSIPWSLYWNEEYQENRDMIKYAVSRDSNQIYYVADSLKNNKAFMLELLSANPDCYFGMTDVIKKDEDVAKFIISKNWMLFVLFADDSLKNESFLRRCNLSDENIKMILDAINEQRSINASTSDNQRTTSNSKVIFDTSAYKRESFMEGLYKCNSKEELVRYVDSIVDSLPKDKNAPEVIGISADILYGKFTSNGEFKYFIDPSIKISNQNIAYKYRIYDRAYLYKFAYDLRTMKVDKDANLLPYVMRFLDSYFGFPKDKVDRREDYLYYFAEHYAEDFYKKHNIALQDGMDACDQMQVCGDFPLSVLKGTYSAKCIERSALAQNILQMCGYDSSIMYGECLSNGVREGHSWNVIYDSEGNLTVADFSNTVRNYKDGKYVGKSPYYFQMSKMDYLLCDGTLKMPGYHYENGKFVYDGKNRVYAIGKSLDMVNENVVTNNQNK